MVCFSFSKEHVWAVLLLVPVLCKTLNYLSFCTAIKWALAAISWLHIQRFFFSCDIVNVYRTWKRTKSLSWAYSDICTSKLKLPTFSILSHSEGGCSSWNGLVEFATMDNNEIKTFVLIREVSFRRRIVHEELGIDQVSWLTIHAGVSISGCPLRGREGEYGRSWGECKGNWDVREDTRATLSPNIELFSVMSVTSST